MLCMVSPIHVLSLAALGLTLHPQVSKNFKLSTQQQSLKKMQATLVKPDELVKIKFTDRK